MHPSEERDGEAAYEAVMAACVVAPNVGVPRDGDEVVLTIVYHLLSKVMKKANH